jgi:hypothetical protein
MNPRAALGFSPFIPPTPHDSPGPIGHHYQPSPAGSVNGGGPPRTSTTRRRSPTAGASSSTPRPPWRRRESNPRARRRPPRPRRGRSTSQLPTPPPPLEPRENTSRRFKGGPPRTAFRPTRRSPSQLRSCPRRRCPRRCTLTECPAGTRRPRRMDTNRDRRAPTAVAQSTHTTPTAATGWSRFPPPTSSPRPPISTLGTFPVPTFAATTTAYRDRSRTNP